MHDINVIEKMNKAEIQEVYTHEIGTAPDESLTKAALIQAIIDKRAENGNSNEGGNGNEQSQQSNSPASAPAAEEKRGGKPEEYRVVKMEGGKVVQESRINKTVWANLPENKHGWQIAPPAELNS